MQSQFFIRNILNSMIDEGQRWLPKLEKHFKSDVVSIYGYIEAEMMGKVHILCERCRSKSRWEDLTLIISTNGGDIGGVEYFRDYIKPLYKNVNIVVVDKAFSTGTLLSLHADKLYVFEHAKFGMIDPQVENGHSAFYWFNSANERIFNYEADAINEGLKNEVYEQIIKEKQQQSDLIKNYIDRWEVIEKVKYTAWEGLSRCKIVNTRNEAVKVILYLLDVRGSRDHKTNVRPDALWEMGLRYEMLKPMQSKRENKFSVAHAYHGSISLYLKDPDSEMYQAGNRLSCFTQSRYDQYY